MLLSENVLNLFGKAQKEPRLAVSVTIALTRGYILKLWFRLKRVNVTIGKNFRAYSWIHIKGPGKVVVGDNVSFCMSFLKRPCLLTYRPESEIRIGSGCYVGGVRISCVSTVDIGAEALLGSSTIIDSDILPHERTLFDKSWIDAHVRPVSIGGHFWSGTNSMILGGSRLGEECVLGAGAVLVNKEAEERSLLLGNPARKIGVTRDI